MQDVSSAMDILAILLVMSKLPGHYPYVNEASNLLWYGKTAFKDPRLDRPSNRRNCSSLGPRDPRYEVKVLRNTPQSQILQSFGESKGQVVALVPGQGLNCGIGPRARSSDEQPITCLSAKDVLRWSKLSEWLGKFDQRNPRHEVALSQSENLDYGSSLSWKLRSEKIVPYNALSVHVSDLPGDSSLALDSEIWRDAMDFVVGSKVLSILLVALPLIYGGIHLTTWSFHFASQTENLLWKIACIDIMGTMPIGMTFNECISCVRRKAFGSRSSPIGRFYFVHYTSWIILAPMFIFYALSRIYIVVESFISLRHVPIGVYAAIPWVQAIPHI